MNEQKFSIQAAGKTLTASVTDTGAGVIAVITGGDSPHVGAVSIKRPGEEMITHEFPGHRDSAVSDRWAEELCRYYNDTAVVSCGIHYDNASPEQINEIVEAAQQLLTEATLGEN